ncbi:MAG: arginase family protein [Bacteroidales bacterium]|nr:arginase family protein [Bacteroidales bacterium]
MTNPVVFDFSGVYEQESFCSPGACTWLDCTHLTGTDCYCDSEGQKAIRELIADIPPDGIHFIDNGNYHYITKFWTDKIREPWSLVLFDEHTDMQADMFGMLSCGDWVKEVIDTNPFLKSVVIVGASDRLISQVPEEYASRVHFYGENEIRQQTVWQEFCRERIAEPIYISIDKDVLRRDDAATNWDQGSMPLWGLEMLLRSLLQHDRVIGIDICGECPVTSDIIKEEAEIALDSHANAELLTLIRDSLRK